MGKKPNQSPRSQRACILVERTAVPARGEPSPLLTTLPTLPGSQFTTHGISKLGALCKQESSRSFLVVSGRAQVRYISADNLLKPLTKSQGVPCICTYF